MVRILSSAPGRDTQGGGQAPRIGSVSATGIAPVHSPGPDRPAPRPGRGGRSRGQPADPDAALAATLRRRDLLPDADLARARALADRDGVPLAEVVLRTGLVAEAPLLRAETAALGLDVADPGRLPADPGLSALLPAEAAARHLAVPWRSVGQVVAIATARPGAATAIRAALRGLRPGQRVVILAAPRPEVEAQIDRVYGAALARLAESRTPMAESCRGFRGRAAAGTLTAASGCVAAVGLWPGAAVAVLCALALAVALANSALKAAALWAAVRLPRPAAAAPAARILPAPQISHRRLPRITLAVPLFREARIARSLVCRLDALDYPRHLLEVLVLVEADDTATRDAIERATLPAYMRVVSVPAGHPRTKPRALNHALVHAGGDIVGVYDAEDAPEADQLRRVAARFQAAPADVACLQGQLDYYNPRRSWIARAFTLEYASWFRVILPGLSRMGFLIPLGGTTLFFRRPVLEAIGAWDAHNVTEDADLGIRLARRGYRTEILETTTFEEANARLWPWIKQRSRWLKGYAMTYAVHMRRPAQLWRDVGARRFWGVQMQFGGTLAGFLTAPLLWSFLALPVGLSHPLTTRLPQAAPVWLMGLFVVMAAVNLGVALHGARLPRLRGLRPWALTLPAYYPLASVAVLRGLWCLLRDPFFWSKTEHGAFGGDAEVSDPPPRGPSGGSRTRG